MNKKLQYTAPKVIAVKLTVGDLLFSSGKDGEIPFNKSKETSFTGYEDDE